MRQFGQTLSEALTRPLVIAMAACALAVGAVHFAISVAERSTSHDERLQSLARIGAESFPIRAKNGGFAWAASNATSKRPDENDFQQFRDWSWAFVTDRDVIGVGWVDADGFIMAVQPDDLAGTIGHAHVSKVGDGWVALDGVAGELNVFRQPVGDGASVVLIGRKRQFLSEVAHRSWPMWVLVVLMVGIFWAWSRRLVDQRVLAPLRAVRALADPADDRRAGRVATQGDIDLGRLIHNITRLAEDNKSSRVRLRQLKRSMDAHVAHQTRQIEVMLRRAKKQAWIDPLTGLGNRRLLDDRLEALVSDSLSQGDDLSIAIFDLDNFKGLNDSQGHAKGDELLSFVGELLRGSLRSSDIGLRLGGDEFAVVLMGCAIEKAAETADRLIKLLSQRASFFKVKPPVTMSAGVASLNYHTPRTGAELLAAADAGLYRAKRAGKCSVGIVPPTVASTASVPTRRALGKTAII